MGRITLQAIKNLPGIAAPGEIFTVSSEAVCARFLRAGRARRYEEPPKGPGYAPPGPSATKPDGPTLRKEMPKVRAIKDHGIHSAGDVYYATPAVRDELIAAGKAVPAASERARTLDDGYHHTGGGYYDIVVGGVYVDRIRGEAEAEARYEALTLEEGEDAAGTPAEED